MSTTDKDLAAGGILASYDRTQLFAGDAEVVTAEGIVAAAQAELAKYTVVAKNAAGELVVLDPAAVDGTQIAVGILTQKSAVNATYARTVAYYVGGFFNHDALVWPAALDTLAERKAAFERTPIRIGSVRL